MANAKSPKRVIRRREIRAFPEPALHSRIADQAKRLRISLGNFLLLAAEEKLARDGAATEAA